MQFLKKNEQAYTWKSTVLGSDRRSGSDRQSEPTLTLSLTLTLTLPDLNLSIFPSIPCLVSGRRSEPIIILWKNRMHINPH